MASLAVAGGAISTSISFVLLLMLSLCPHTFCEEQREFDYFLLALQWPGTLCQRTRHCCPSNGCCKSSAATSEFTIHGLWTDYDDGSWPSCCSGSEFDIHKIKPLIEILNKYWPSLTCSSSSNCHGGKGLFWAHEWEKHGTCSYPVIKDEYSYFKTALDLYFKFNITKILNDAGYAPTSNSEHYPLGDIVAIIKKAVGSLPILVCSHSAVEELRICFHKDFTPRDCGVLSIGQDNVMGSRSSCPRYISLPEYKPSYLLEGVNSELQWSYS
ncbi:ribonuclease 2-like [Aristolochia californica]|uniref:ribonuclease 2-like n=1 Tax=Aristolochia californica TaxID=171875 RepID=UPI0035D8B092